jgi:hypothetical protein
MNALNNQQHISEHKCGKYELNNQGSISGRSKTSNFTLVLTSTLGSTQPVSSEYWDDSSWK